MKKCWLIVCGVHSYFQRALMLTSVRMKAFLHQQQETKYQEPLIPLYGTVSLTLILKHTFIFFGKTNSS